MGTKARPFAIVTGASTGIGFELARCCAADGYDLLVVADEPAIHEAATSLRRGDGGSIESVEADLSTIEGVERLLAAASGRPVSALIANAGRGLGKAFLDQDWNDIRRVIDTNVTGTLYLIHRVVNDMRLQRSGRVLIVGSIAGFIPGTYQAVYNGTKAMLDSFAVALRHELKETGITVTCLQPGPTETDFFERADLMDTKVGVSKKQPADEVAKIGYEAMLRGDGDVVAGLRNKVQAAAAHITPDGILAEQHARMAKPGTANKS